MRSFRMALRAHPPAAAAEVARARNGRHGALEGGRPGGARAVSECRRRPRNPAPALRPGSPLPPQPRIQSRRQIHAGILLRHDDPQDRGPADPNAAAARTRRRYIVEGCTGVCGVCERAGMEEGVGGVRAQAQVGVPSSSTQPPTTTRAPSRPPRSRGRDERERERTVKEREEQERERKRWRRRGVRRRENENENEVLPSPLYPPSAPARVRVRVQVQVQVQPRVRHRRPNRQRGRGARRTFAKRRRIRAQRRRSGRGGTGPSACRRGRGAEPFTRTSSISIASPPVDAAPDRSSHSSPHAHKAVPPPLGASTPPSTLDPLNDVFAAVAALVRHPFTRAEHVLVSPFSAPPPSPLPAHLFQFPTDLVTEFILGRTRVRRLTAPIYGALRRSVSFSDGKRDGPIRGLSSMGVEPSARSKHIAEMLARSDSSELDSDSPTKGGCSAGEWVGLGHEHRAVHAGFCLASGSSFHLNYSWDGRESTAWDGQDERRDSASWDARLKTHKLGCSVNHAWEGRLRSKSAGWGARESASWDGLGWWRKKKDVALIVFVCIESHWLRTSVDELRRGRRRYSTRRPHSFPPHNPTLSHEERRTVNSERHGFGQTRGITGEGAAGAGTGNFERCGPSSKTYLFRVSDSHNIWIEPEQKAIALSKKLYHDFKEEPNWRQEQKCPSCFQTWHVSKGVERVVDCEQNPKQLNPVNFATGPTCRQPTKPVNVGWIEMSSSEKDERDRKKAQAKKEDKKASAKERERNAGRQRAKARWDWERNGGGCPPDLDSSIPRLVIQSRVILLLFLVLTRIPQIVLFTSAHALVCSSILSPFVYARIFRRHMLTFCTEHVGPEVAVPAARICSRPSAAGSCCGPQMSVPDQFIFKWRPLLNPTQTCRPHFFPDPGVEAASHSLKAKTRFYIVKSGRVEGIFTSHYMADEQVKEFSGQDSISTRTYAEALAVWAAHCGNSHHLHGGPCPDLGFNGQTTLWGVCGFPPYFHLQTPPEFATCPPVFFPTANTNAPVYYVVTKGTQARLIFRREPSVLLNSQSFTVRKEALRAWAQHCQTNHGRLCLIAGSKTYWAIKGLRAVFDSRESVLDHAEAVGLKTVHLYGHFDENLVKSFLQMGCKCSISQFTLLKLVVEGLDLLVNK
ncbi:hypothetical protein C8F04DRAFT_1199502 [Mycena alexandri]|uniref:Ribonuclease H1 N-terminal domain-containing protein n=1 Tax=Mycena alexandri TaxID=1745969 RepID=A0AAD6WNP6_9AGAR|nr:hypothetical protein C8F04DRAFT_1199502 [Mycena alexandri]